METMLCDARTILERNCVIASEEFDRLRKQIQTRIGSLADAEYRDLSARVQDAWVLEQRAETALNRHRLEHGC